MAGGELQFWTRMLRFEGFEVVHVEEDTPCRRYSFTVVPTHGIGVCPQCGRACEDVKQRRTREGIRDLPLGCNTVELKVRVSQYDCAHCQQSFTPPIPFLAEGAHATERFMDRAAQLIRQGDIANAAQFLGVPEKTLENWYYDHLTRSQKSAASTPLLPIRRLGIDELSLKKSSDSSLP